ncbi:MAG: metal-dependent hydrolase [Candidatus Omnitrophica bacterium]|nr:metal-dependent hydrolase [Candidatus Omnitrophota bacterium]
MPQAVTHILIVIVLVSLIRDYFIKDKKKFPLHYVLIAGLGGLLPDIDIALFWILHFFGYSFDSVHRTFTHTLFFPLVFLLLGFIFWRVRIRGLGKHHLKLHTIFLMIGLGVFIHLILDVTLSGGVRPLYPFIFAGYGLNLVSLLPEPLEKIALPCLDAALLVLWLVYLEVKHKISEFV